MAASKTVAHLADALNDDASLRPRHGVITLSGYGVSIRVDRGHLVFEDGVGASRRRGRLARIGHQLRRLIVIGADGVVSLAALRWLADQKAAFVMLERDGKVLAVTGPVRPSDVRLRRAQGLAHHNATALSIARELIGRKLDEQRHVVSIALRDPPAAAAIESLQAQLDGAHTIDDIRKIEAFAAMAYWGAWRSVQAAFPRHELSRVPAHWQTFTSRHSSLTGSPRLDGLIHSSIDDASSAALAEMRKTWAKESRQQKRQRAGFEKNLHHRWGIAIDHLRMMLTIARELGDSVSEALYREHKTSPLRLECITHLHARACQVAEEILCLLAAGLADGAMARWRTLHEVAAVALLLNSADEELAERYVAHQAIESLRGAQEYRALSARRPELEPLDDAQYQEIVQESERLIAKYGPEFRTQYGWAAAALGKRKPTLRDIEEAAGLDHLRAYYRMASHNVHANPKGVFFKLGLLHEADVILTGSSNAGLADPGHNCAISLAQASVALCTLQPDLDSLVGLRMLRTLSDEVGRHFLDAHDNLSRDASDDDSASVEAS